MIEGSGGSAKDNEFRVWDIQIQVSIEVGHVSLKLRRSIWYEGRDGNHLYIDYSKNQCLYTCVKRGKSRVPRTLLGLALSWFCLESAFGSGG